MRPIDALDQAKDAIRELDCAVLQAKWRELTRGGLPAGGGDGRGGETSLPLPDKTDLKIRSDRLQYEQALRHMATAAATALQIHRAYLERPTDATAKEATMTKPRKGAGPCSNIWCLHVCTGQKDDVLRDHRCPACRMFYKRNGRERPRELCDVTNAACSSPGTAARAS